MGGLGVGGERGTGFGGGAGGSLGRRAGTKLRSATVGGGPGPGGHWGGKSLSAEPYQHVMTHYIQSVKIESHTFTTILATHLNSQRQK